MQVSIKECALFWVSMNLKTDIKCTFKLKSFLPKLQAVRVQTKETDLFEGDISEKEMNRETISNFLINEDNSDIDEEA